MATEDQPLLKISSEDVYYTTRESVESDSLSDEIGGDYADDEMYDDFDLEASIAETDVGSSSESGDSSIRFSVGSSNNFNQSFHLGAVGPMRNATENILISPRLTNSFMAQGHNYKLVPSLLEDNVKLVTDPNLDPGETGILYLAEDCFYTQGEKPKYALTVSQDIYCRMLNEVVSGRKLPCGFYFCCHGDDAAHTGISHDDHVNIKVAWACALAMFSIGVILALA